MPIHSSWNPIFEEYKINIESNNMYPNKENIYRVFEMDIKDIKILLLGQDPYHNVNQADGFCFSVPIGVKIPPSLKNIFKEIQIEFPERHYNYTHGNLESWFYREKIFLLNSALTVEHNKPGSHMKYWENMTNAVISLVSKINTECIFVLLGRYAKSKEKYIQNKNNIITGVHPSPLSAHNGFFNSNIFKTIEDKTGPIDWTN
jgi:uracil-DNA glycosylase